jgi:enamine deaminase RidA (YjgF/YER057c/UK114 family)
MRGPSRGPSQAARRLVKHGRANPGRQVLIAGLVARDVDDKMVGIGDLAAKIRKFYENLELTIEAAGGNSVNPMRVDVYASDITKFDAIHSVRSPTRRTRRIRKRSTGSWWNS